MPLMSQTRCPAKLRHCSEACHWPFALQGQGLLCSREPVGHVTRATSVRGRALEAQPYAATPAIRAVECTGRGVGKVGN